jgi:hydrogenase nickel incorporation protein HypA/HybF
MHELALLEEVRRLGEAQAAEAGASRIHRYKLRIGTLSGVDPEALRFGFGVVMANGCSDGAELELEVVTSLCFCPHCSQTFAPCDVIHACPQCGQLSNHLLQGQDLELVALEVS